MVKDLNYLKSARLSETTRIINHLLIYYFMPVETGISVLGKEDCGIVDITGMVSEEVKKSKIRNGTVTIFCIGSTGAITTMEYESNLSKDLAELL